MLTADPGRAFVYYAMHTNYDVLWNGRSKCRLYEAGEPFCLSVPEEEREGEIQGFGESRGSS